jgi:hypothetical protein
MKKIYVITKYDGSEKKIFFLTDSPVENSWTADINLAKKFYGQGLVQSAASEMMRIDKGAILGTNEFFTWEEVEPLVRTFDKPINKN